MNAGERCLMMTSIVSEWLTSLITTPVVDKLLHLYIPNNAIVAFVAAADVIITVGVDAHPMKECQHYHTVVSVMAYER
jgi:hypothetical protein